jgi:uncharacterized protein (DUF924 family)
MKYQEIIDFWFTEIESKLWWVKDDQFDQQLRDKFGELHASAVKCELFSWREHPEGRLAEVIVLDQFSRNMFRGSPKSFAADPLALALAQEAIGGGDDMKLDKEKRGFLYMPYMHSESAAIHQVAVELFSQPDGAGSLEFELKHKEIIDRFGRYPHRNEVLGRESTEEEKEFLKGPGSSF